MTTAPDTTPDVAAFPPMPDREQEIRARRDAITDAPWGVYRDIDDLLALVDRLKAERDEALLRLHAAAMTRTWTNEDGRECVFVDDLTPALHGTPKTGEGQ